jgi:NAD(P)H-hydrate epimerase
MIRLTRKQLREVDRIAIEEYGIPGIVLMENAARGAADVIDRDVAEGDRSVPIFIFCGKGNNGGDGLAIARHLHIRGYKPQVVLGGDESEFTGDALINWQIVRTMKLPIASEISGDRPIMLDAMYGTGLTRPIEGRAAELVRLMNSTPGHRVAIDVPSGIDCDTGRPIGDVFVRATRTVTFVAAKAGFPSKESKPYIGWCTVADIGAPPEIVERVLRESP